MNLAKYQKLVAALAAGLYGWGAVVVASPSAAITAPEWLGLSAVFGTAFGVFAVPNAK